MFNKDFVKEKPSPSYFIKSSIFNFIFSLILPVFGPRSEWKLNPVIALRLPLRGACPELDEGLSVHSGRSRAGSQLSQNPSISPSAKLGVHSGQARQSPCLSFPKSPGHKVSPSRSGFLDSTPGLVYTETSKHPLHSPLTDL